MSLSVCYHARLQEREDFESEIVNEFIPPLNKTEDGTIMSLTQTQFQAEIRWYIIVTNTTLFLLIYFFRCQEILLDNMILGDNIARNAALRENVFMMTVCIQLKIPLFLVGKPGSSKSLAKSIVSDTFTSDKSTFLNMQVNQHFWHLYECIAKWSSHLYYNRYAWFHINVVNCPLLRVYKMFSPRQNNIKKLVALQTIQQL